MIVHALPRQRRTPHSHPVRFWQAHFLQIHDPYTSEHKIRSASFKSGEMLRESMHRHVRSQYHPEEKCALSSAEPQCVALVHGTPWRDFAWRLRAARAPSLLLNLPAQVLAPTVDAK